MAYKQCTQCKEYHFDHEKCKPLFTVYHEDYLGEDGKAFRGIDAEGAALAYAEYYNSRADYCLMNEEVEVEVDDNGQRVKFVVSAQPDIYYTAKQIAIPA